jgi:hypothetical protein
MAKSLETQLEHKSKAFSIDTAANISYSLAVGAALDYAAGLNLSGIIASRTSATGINILTGGAYGWLREKTYKITNTTEKSHPAKKWVTDTIAFNLGQIPLYATAVTIASLASEGKVDLEKVKHGIIYLATVSPLIGPTLGIFTDTLRRMFKIKTAAEGAY